MKCLGRCGGAAQQLVCRKEDEIYYPRCFPCPLCHSFSFFFPLFLYFSLIFPPFFLPFLLLSPPFPSLLQSSRTSLRCCLIKKKKKKEVTISHLKKQQRDPALEWRDLNFNVPSEGWGAWLPTSTPKPPQKSPLARSSIGFWHGMLCNAQVGSLLCAEGLGLGLGLALRVRIIFKVRARVSQRHLSSNKPDPCALSTILNPGMRCSPLHPL